MWNSNRQVASIEDRIKRHEETYFDNKELEYRKEDIFNELRKTKLWNYYPVKIHSWDYSASQVLLGIYNIPVEMVIDFFCGHLHQVFGIDWEMIPGHYEIRLTSKYKDTNICFEVHEESMQTCKIKRRIVKVRSEEEMEMHRFVYAYEIDCQE